MKEILQEIEQACSKEISLDGLRRAFSIFKPRIDWLNEAAREQTREIYWSHKRRIEKTK